MTVKDLINALEYIDGDLELKVIDENYGSPMEYELHDKIITTNDGDAYLIISQNSQIGYYNEDRTEDVFSF